MKHYLEPSASSSRCYANGVLFADSGFYIEALANFDQTIQLQADHEAAWVFRGVVLIHLGRYREALDSCNYALKLYPSYSEAWIFRGVALHRLGHHRAAYASYDRAVGQRSRSFWNRLLDRGRRDQALG